MPTASTTWAKPAFVWEMLQAYHMRPRRAETLYDLAKYFRERGENHTSLLFSEAGMQLPRPDDLLFVNDFVYHTGLKEEFSICAYYDEARRDRGAAVCNELALSRAGTAQSRETARSNLFWYLKPLSISVPSFKPHRIPFDAPDGYVAMNPSVVNDYGSPVVLVRTVNYTITPDGSYEIRGVGGAYSRDNPIHTRNHMVFLSDALTVTKTYELQMPEDWPEPQFDLVRGLEDMRLFKWGTIAAVRELNPHGWCQQVLGQNGQRKILSKEGQHEKNWMPWLSNGELRFVYRLGTIMDRDGNIVAQHDTGLDTGHISGGSQVIEAEGHYLALVHEARTIPGRPNRYYSHRFVRLAENGVLLAISSPFVFFDRQIEFAAGLAYFPAKRQLMASFGVRDAEAWLAWMDLDEVLNFVGGA